MRKITKAGVQRRLIAYRQRLARVVAGDRTKPDERGLSAGLEKFVLRTAGQQFVGFPTKWRIDYPPLESPAPMAVLVHVYFTDLVDELLEELRAIDVPFDLIITNASGQPIDLEGRLDHLPVGSARVLPVENRGRDIWPMVQVVNAGLLDPYDVVFKIHTKKSAWREDHALAGSGDEWKRGFYRDLLGSTENVHGILSGLFENPQIGAVTSTGSVMDNSQWGGDRPIVTSLMQRLRIHSDPDDLRFASGSIYWIRGFLLQGLRSLCLDTEDFEDEAGQVDGTTAHAIERMLGILTEEAGMHSVERPDVHADEVLTAEQLTQRLRSPEKLARAVAYYLPQYHTFPQNDDWWGRGFTEWTNVAKARPVFFGHNQPFLPGELGFYDLRVDEVRERQAELARDHGLSGFMYYYYWFGGTKLMDMPIERLVESDVDQPFCIMWANENWTRRWDGDTKNVLIAQEYDRVPAEQFIDDVMPLLKDGRYMRIDGGAIIGVYRIAQIPNYADVIDHWRRRAREEGVGELHLVSVDVGTGFDGLVSSYEAAGVQGFIGFPPHNHKYQEVPHGGLGVSMRLRGHIYDYGAMARDAERRYLDDYPANDYPGAMVNFDNTARRQWEPDLWLGSNPYTFRRWLRSCVNAVVDREPEHRVVIINAWNEWAEGAVLEPSARFGNTYLKAARSALT